MADNIFDMIEKRKIGLPIFMKLFKLNSSKLKSKIRDIVGEVWFDQNCSGMLTNGKVRKTLVDDEPTHIEIEFYDSLEINCYGIWFKPEHGQQKCIKEFDKYFKLPR